MAPKRIDTARCGGCRAAPLRTMSSRSLVFILLLGGYFTGWGAPRALGQAPATEEGKACGRNLGLIHEAIQAYRQQHKDIPNWLSDLVPRFVFDPAVLVCPASKRLGVTSAEVMKMKQYGLCDPKTSYFYEFGATNVPPQIAGGSPKTMKEWKRRQMGILGSGIPIVRCHLHGDESSINLSFAGVVSETHRDWETKYASVVFVEDLSPGRLFAEELIFEIVTIPLRDPKASPKMVDLSNHYNASTKKSWHPGDAGNHLASLSTGLQKLAGTEFDIRGIVQLSARKEWINKYPPAVKGIKIAQRCQVVHLLHGASYGARPGTEVGKYIFHFANNETRELPIIYGKHLLDWWDISPFQGDHSQVGWEGTNPTARSLNKSIRLYATRWSNPLPDSNLETMDFVSSMASAALFVVAVTVE